MTDVIAVIAEHATSQEELATFVSMLGLEEPGPFDRPRRPRYLRPRYLSQGCGTRAGYQRHKDRGQTPCGPCSEANLTYMREYASKRYDPKRRRRYYEAAKARGYYA